MKRKITLTLFAAALALPMLLPLVTHSQSVVLDDVETKIDQGMARIQIRFTMPVRYLRHFPQNQGELLRIYYQVVGLSSDDISLREETRRIEPTSVLPGFNVTYTPPASDNLLANPPSVIVQFDRPESYTVRASDDDHAIDVYVPLTPTGETPQ
jgi:hypothetical protein